MTGGIIPLLVQHTCGPLTAGSSSFFNRGGVASRQFRQCWVAGQYVGPCGVIVNFRNSSSTGGGTGAQNYVATMCGTSSGSTGSEDGDPFARDGGCFSAKGYHHVLVISNPLDVEEGGALDLTRATETVAPSNATDNTTNPCTQGADYQQPTNGLFNPSDVVGGAVTVCESMGMVVFN